MGAPLNPISFRFPFDIQGKAHDDVVSAIRYCFSGLVDINQAIPQLKQQIDAKMTTSQAASPGSSSHSGGGGGGGSTISGLGAVNDQLGVTSYQTQQSDNGAKIIVGDSSAVAVTLDNTVTIPWFTIIDNDSSSVASLSPMIGSSLLGPSEIKPGGFGIVYFDGTNFWCGATGSDSGSGITQLTGDVTAGPGSGSQPSTLKVAVAGWDVFDGSAGTNLGNIQSMLRATSLSECFLTVTASDATTDLTFDIQQNGVSVFTAAPTVTHGATAGQQFAFPLKTVPLPVAKNDKFNLNISAGTSSWKVSLVVR